MLDDINLETLNRFEIEERIFQLRTKEKLSQAKLAEKVDISGNSISNIENGKQLCKFDNIKRFAHALGTSVNFLLYGSSSDNGKVLDETSDKVLLQDEMLAKWNKMSL